MTMLGRFLELTGLLTLLAWTLIALISSLKVEVNMYTSTIMNPISTL